MPSSPPMERAPQKLRLQDGSRVAVVGGGPAGSFFSYFLLDMAQHAGLRLELDLIEARDFTQAAPAGCNMCGGIVSESLVQTLAAEGIELPSNVVQRGIDSYVLHTNLGRVQIDTPFLEKRIAAVYRGPGPRDMTERTRRSFDDFLQSKAAEKGARLVRSRITSLRREPNGDGASASGGLVLEGKDLAPRRYDLLAVATGVNSGALKLLDGLDLPYHPPQTSKTCIREYRFGEKKVGELMGTSMHVFLLDLRRIEFAALIPKGDYITLCVLGDDIDNDLIAEFMALPEVKSCFPPGWEPGKGSCFCAPRISLGRAAEPYADRVVFVGDCAITRLYKDGIGAAYRTAKSAARTAVFEGIGAHDFRRHYEPVCREIARDNGYGRFTFAAASQFKKLGFARQATLRMVKAEQAKPGRRRRMSSVLWDLFTGSATYRSIFLRQLHPVFLARLAGHLLASAWRPGAGAEDVPRRGQPGNVGRIFRDGETIVRQGELGDRMFVLQEGTAEIWVERDGEEVLLRTTKPGEIVGEMALFEPAVRSASVRARGEVRALSVDRRTLMERLNQDPTLAFNIVQTLSNRVRELSDQLAEARAHSEGFPPRAP